MGPILKNLFRGELFPGRPDFICAICTVFCDIPPFSCAIYTKIEKIKKILKKVLTSKKIYGNILVSGGDNTPPTAHTI